MVKLERFDAAAARASYWCTLCHLGPDRVAGVPATHFASLENHPPGQPVLARLTYPVCDKHVENIEELLGALQERGLLAYKAQNL
jgi:hypothetical protein